ncbi:DUF4349 domain-containing protein [Candidatus Micrarchaeota archaeon]|nr:DUF4349 domain-containing protein [Candidatus Micrarchaeota archaeon]
MLRNIAVLGFLVALLAFGCLGMEQSSSNTGDSRALTDASYAPSVPSYDAGGVSESQYVTKEGSITLKVAEGTLESKFTEMKDKLSAQGADMSDITYNEYSDRKQYTLTVKVAPAKFESISAMLQQLGEVKDMSVQLEDVTQQYTDLDTRIKNRQIELDRLYELYNQSSKVSDLLDVEREITRVETDLEILKQEKQYLVSKVERSTITITVYEDKPATQQLTLSLEGLGQMFFAAMAAAVTLVVLAVGFLLPFAIVVGILWLVYKAFRGDKKAKPRAPEHSRIPPQP